MDETISPMIEMADKHHVASDRYNVSQGSTTSTDYGDEFIQDFRLSVAVPVLPGTLYQKVKDPESYDY